MTQDVILRLAEQARAECHSGTPDMAAAQWLSSHKLTNAQRSQLVRRGLASYIGTLDHLNRTREFGGGHLSARIDGSLTLDPPMNLPKREPVLFRVRYVPSGVRELRPLTAFTRTEIEVMREKERSTIGAANRRLAVWDFAAVSMDSERVELVADLSSVAKQRLMGLAAEAWPLDLEEAEAAAE